MTFPIEESKTLTRSRFWGYLPFLILLIFVVLVTGLPLMNSRIMSGHDALEYLPRQVEFHDNLVTGTIIPRWAADFSRGYGNPTFNFSPPLFYYVSSVWVAMGANFIVAENLSCLLLLLFAGVGMFVLAADLFGRWGGLVSAVAYLLAPYVLLNLYVRHAFADFSAFAFLPLSFWGLSCFVTGRPYFYGLVGVFCSALLILSSVSVSLLAFPALLVLTIWLAIEYRSWRILGGGIWYLALGLGLAAFFWVPCLAERDLVHIERRLDAGLDWHYHFVYLRQLIYSPWGYGLSYAGPEDGMSFATGPVHLVMIPVALFLLLNTGKAFAKAWVRYCVVLVLGAAFFASDLSEPLWERLSLLHPLQFPWRFLALIAFGTAILCGTPFLLIRARRWKMWVMTSMLCVMLVFGLPMARPAGYLSVDETEYSPEMIRQKNITTYFPGQLVPIGVQVDPKDSASEPITLLEGEADVEPVEIYPARRLFRATITDTARLRLNTFYFPGWTVLVDDAIIATDHDNPSGLMEFTVAPGQHIIVAQFRDTLARQIGVWMSILTLLCLVATVLILPRFSRVPNRIRIRAGD